MIKRALTDRLRRCDVLIIGAGVLGVTIGYWLSTLLDAKIIIVDKELTLANHTSSRNTGVLHRPFYLDPKRKRIFAQSASASYRLWRDLATKFELPWKDAGSLELALDEPGLRTLDTYANWGIENGMAEAEMELLDKAATERLEPQVVAEGALHSKTDVSVDFGSMTKCLGKLGLENGVEFLGGLEADSIRENPAGEVEVGFKRSTSLISTRFLINAAGGGALNISRLMGLAPDLACLNFRGEYWEVRPPFANLISRNIYTLPKFPQFPFLDPHFVIRSDGTRQIGPNAVLVTGPYSYKGFGLSSIGNFVSEPLRPRLRVVMQQGFLRLALKEFRSSMTKSSMCDRVRKFVPRLTNRMLGGSGMSGIRSIVAGKQGIMPEAVILQSKNSLHVLNYNSPGATGAPVFSALLVKRLLTSDYLPKPKKNNGLSPLWTLDRLFEEELGSLI